MRLLARPLPYSDESYRGYIWRLAWKNGYKSPSEIFRAYGSNPRDRVRVDQHLSENLNIESINELFAANNRCSDRFILRQHYRVCPICFHDDEYFRAIWDYALIPWCVKHNIPLLALGTRFPFDLRSKINCAWRRPYEEPEVGFPLALEIAHSMGLCSVYRPKPVDVLKGLSPDELQKLVMLLGAYAIRRKCRRPQKAPIKSDILQSQKILNGAAGVLLSWPEGLDAVLPGQLVLDRKVHAQLGYIYQGIHRELNSPAFRPFVDAFDSYLVSRWPGVIDSKSAWIGLLAKKYCRYEAGTACAKRWHISTSRLRRWVKEGMIEGHCYKLPSGRTQLTVLKGQDGEAKALSGRLSLKAAAVELGLSRSCLRELLRDGIIEGEQPSTKRVWEIPVSSVRQFVHAVTNVTAGVPPADAIPIKRLMRYHANMEHSLSDLIAAGLGKELQIYVSLNSDEHIADRLFVRIEDYHTWARSSESISIVELATLLGIKEEVAYQLVNRGLFQTVNRGRLGRQIRSNDVVKFESEYVFAAELAKAHHTSSKNLVNRLSSLEIEPVIGPAIDGSRQYLYKVADLVGSAGR